MVYLIFHTVIIINRKNWRITIKLHFENLCILKKRTYIHARTPPLPVHFCSLFNDPPPLLNKHTFWMSTYITVTLNGKIANALTKKSTSTYYYAKGSYFSIMLVICFHSEDWSNDMYFYKQTNKKKTKKESERDCNRTLNYNHIVLNGRVFVYRLSCFEFESCCSHIIIRYLCLFWARSFLKFRQIQSVDSL